jgi:hypothetical protein
VSPELLLLVLTTMLRYLVGSEVMGKIALRHSVGSFRLELGILIEREKNKVKFLFIFIRHHMASHKDFFVVKNSRDHFSD